jgi:Family of unknown function (DUF6152)
MFNKYLLLAAASSLLFNAGFLKAHHSFAAEYDANKPIKIQGRVTKVEFINPHSWLHVDVTSPDGKVTNYACETAPPNGLYRLGWTKSSIKPGDEVIVEGVLAKDGSTLINTKSVTTADGRKLFAGSSAESQPNSGSGTPKQ